MHGEIHAHVAISLHQVDAHEKPYVVITFPNGHVERVTANIAEMIGGAGRGATLRHEDMKRQGKQAYPPEF